MSDQITLNVGSKSFKVSKSHLIEISPYFKAMFTSPFVELDQTEVTLEAVNPDHFEAVLEFTQGKSIPMDDDNVYEVLKIADMFHLDMMALHCHKFLEDNLQHNNALKVWKAADTYRLSGLAKKAKALILWHFPTLLTNQHWNDLTEEDVYSIVSSPELHVKSETDLIQLIHQRFESCPPQNPNDKFVKLLQAVQIQIQDSPQSLVKSRKLPIQPSVQGSSGYIHSFNPKNVTLSRTICLPPMKPTSSCPLGFRTCALGPYIYSLGGEEIIGRSNWNRKIWRYDTILQVWDCVMELPVPIRHMGICTDNERYIILVGGYGRFRVKSDAVFLLDMETKSCATLARLPCPMNSPPCCVFNGDLFVFGPNSVRGSLSDPEKLDWSRFDFDVSQLPQGVCVSFIESAVVTSADAIFFSQGCHLFKFCPVGQKTEVLEFVGQFKDECVHMCLVDNRIYNFDEARIEVYDILSKRFEIVWTGKGVDLQSYNGCFGVVVYNSE